MSPDVETAVAKLAGSQLVVAECRTECDRLRVLVKQASDRLQSATLDEACASDELFATIRRDQGIPDRQL